MATKSEDGDANHLEKPPINVTSIQANATSVALAAAIASQKPSIWSKNMLKLYLIMAVGYLVSTMNGYDSSLMGAINSMLPYQETFGLDGAGKFYVFTSCLK